MSVSKRKECKVRFRRRLGLCSQLLKYISLAFFFSLQNTSFSQDLRSTRPNCFILQSSQAGSTTDIDDLIITDLDLGQVFYSNTFSTTSSATGTYSFTVAPGDYYVKFSNLPAGFLFSPSTAGTASAAAPPKR